MALTPSMMLELGTRAPDFSLLEPATGNTVSLSDFLDGRGLVVIFMCNHCPYVKHIADEFAAFADECQSKGLAVVGISSNDPSHRVEDDPHHMVLEVEHRGYSPYLYDETQEVAKAYRAACTPDLYLFDANLNLVYRGQFDDSRPGNDIEVNGQDLREAVDAMLEGREPISTQKASIGCNIKWKPGNEPDYFK